MARSNKISFVPNLLTIFRLILALPYIVLFSLLTGSFWKSCDQYISILISLIVIFALSMLSDFLDGYIARKTNSISNFGKLFDPIADKIIISTTLIFFALLNYTYVALTVVFIIRDLVVDGSRNLAAKNNLKIEASIWGKLKTIMQIVAIFSIFGGVLFANNLNWQNFKILINIPMYIALFVSIVSGFLYFLPIVPYLKK
ncbi:CDP-diacylglycerol--glycerol-3-phosphate 3-phosphatidyltransferase [Mycoplasmopsis pulmonis]|nr:CDP-diacylglycerol--glycerol-3-phosphate 3-phosphatidyltransferase [Mycoplasmopsis pulmonis]MDZ7293135.1 CDP-diacylglycerol--glycerol-3-phosphate 3-phosphatidyltransferase [Mycoplasmopsis pulmonis]VEU67932.1 CDP-diacylglycerol--glycerol-3-phosphate 3-phosphatidyltransferase [Mycoplasmopsis pulmonis]